MYTSEALLDIHERAHRSLVKLLEHCAQFSAAEFVQEWPGFGYPSLWQQFYHEIAAQAYWIGVLHGRMDVDEQEDLYSSVALLEAFRGEVYEMTATYLRSASAEELNTPRAMVTWGGREQVLRPAHVVVRTAAHLYQHQGQVAAMCRLLGKPIPAGLDFPIL